MRDDRQTVLVRIRASLKTAHLPAARSTIPPRAPESPTAPTALIDSFTRELTAVGGKVYQPENLERAIQQTIELIHAVGGNAKVLAWEDAELPLSGLGEAMRDAGFIRFDPRLPTDGQERRARLAELERAGVGLTGALAGIADTGSLALLSGTNRPRLASLLPPVHIALLRTRDLFPTMAAFFSAYPTVVRDGSNLTFVTGPSRSADIELTLTRGVHGPRDVHLILLDGER